MSHADDSIGLDCPLAFAGLSETHIRPLRVGSLVYPECYRNPGAWVSFPDHGLRSKLARGLAALALFICPGAAQAWDFKDENGDCRVSQTFEGAGNTYFAFTQDQEWFDLDDRIFIMVQNDNWSIKDGEKLGVLRFETDEGWFENEANGNASENLKGIISLAVSFKNFAIAMDGYPQSLVITRNGKVIDRLSLSGFSYEYGRFKQCHERKAAVVRERQRKEALDRNIPHDPFSAGK